MRLIIGIVFTLTLSIVPANSAIIQGIGSHLCSQFNVNIAAPSGSTRMEGLYYAWAQGWMSRLNVDRESSGASFIRGEIKAPGYNVGSEQKAYLRSYCASNPSKAFAQGASELYMAILRASGPAV